MKNGLQSSKKLLALSGMLMPNSRRGQMMPKPTCLGAIQLMNEMYEEKEALITEKEDLAKERAVLVSQKEAF